MYRLLLPPPAFFERLVVDVLVKMGYGGTRQDAGQVVGRSGDDGIDGIIKEDRLGLDVIYVQAKRWDGVVGRPEVQKFAGALQGHRARKGIFITTSSFIKDADEYVSRIDSQIVLIDGEMLAQLMIDHNVGGLLSLTMKSRRWTRIISLKHDSMAAANPALHLTADSVRFVPTFAGR
jgi:restriction endonuclease Mrr